MAVITISGNLGSYAREIGQLVAQELGFDYVDRAILTEAARALGVPERAIAGRDDGAPPPHLRERIASFLQDFLERSAVAGAADPMSAVSGLEALMATTYREAAALPSAGEAELNDRRYKEAITTIMTELAARGNVVIIGRGSQSILRDCADALHVSTTAPLDVRVQRVAERDGVPPAKAREYVEESDRGRADFHHKYFKLDPTDPSLYDLVLNSARFSIDDAARLLVTAFRARTAPPTAERCG
ncbi:MAG: cytidylate kinase-like family protein [Dehalococcoidia bacterium]|jgi:cytidylate kinase